MVEGPRFASPFWPAALLTLLALPAACRTGGSGNSGADAAGSGAGGGGAPVEDGGVVFARSELLAAFGTCAASGARAFRAKAAALDVAVTALVATPDEATRGSARASFREAMDTWQVMEMMQFGPTAPASVLGGRDYRDYIYAWPLFGRCAVEEELVARTYESPNFDTVLLVNRRGLAAIEYLLFYEGSDTECPATSPALAGWMALTPAQRDERKRAYAAAAARSVLARAVGLDEAWDPAKANFVQTMRSAGPGNAVYPTVQDGIQSVGLAIFFLDQVVKDLKLTRPLNELCTTAACLESRFAGRSKANIAANLDGLRRIMEGCDGVPAGLGFDDLLVNIGAGDVADSLRAAAVGAEAALDAIDEPDLDQALVQDRDSVVALRDAISVVTTIVKTTFFTVLNFEPSIIPTDND